MNREEALKEMHKGKTVVDDWGGKYYYNSRGMLIREPISGAEYILKREMPDYAFGLQAKQGITGNFNTKLRKSANFFRQLIPTKVRKKNEA